MINILIFLFISIEFNFAYCLDHANFKAFFKSQKIIPVFHEINRNNFNIAKKYFQTADIGSISMRNSNSLQSLTSIYSDLDHLKSNCLFRGASTIVSEKQIYDVTDSGANFMTSTYFSPTLIKISKLLNVPFICGVSSYEEGINAINLGCNYLKLYPINSLTPQKGLEILKKLKLRDSNVLIFFSGGIDRDLVPFYFASGVDSIFMGINYQNFEESTKYILNYNKNK